MSRSILLVDDDPWVLATLTAFLEARRWTVTAAPDGRSGIEEYERERPDLVICDLELPGLSGLQVLEILRSRDPEVIALILTGHGDVATAVEALKLGAENFLTKPVDFGHLEMALERAYEKAQLRRRGQVDRERRADNCGLSELEDWPSTRRLGEQVSLIAGGNAPVLLGGETGTGKGWLASMIHRASPRQRGPFVEVNCAGLSTTFLDSELFGHEKGAFTDAKTMKRGLFELADGGTLFLDEIGDLAPELQPKLLKVLESHRFRRLGGTRELQVDVRLIAATHRDLEAEVRAGRFREDLFYRLAVLPLRLPSLRDRGRAEVAALARRILPELQGRLGHGPATLTTEALDRLASYSWPGNIRELRNVLERALLLAQHADAVGVEHLPADCGRAAATPPEEDGDFCLRSAERRQIARALAYHEQNRTRAARALGITRATLYNKMRAYGIEAEAA